MTRKLIVVSAALLLLPGTLLAQSAISGVVRDPSGAVLPGVTVEASSPAMIERVRSVVTDGEGAYKILELRPGTYRVTFNLPGFVTLQREGIELPAQFTATVHVELRVGGVEETITVSGASPTVDIQNVQSQRVLSQDILQSIPAARTPQALAVLMPGVIGQGISGVPSGREELNTATHGSSSNESVFLIDGFTPAMPQGPGGAGGYTYRVSAVYVQEMTVVTSGGTALQAYGGTVTNVIPREGGNRFSGVMYSEYSGDSLQGDNLTDDFRAQGLSSVSSLVDLWDVYGGVGGPIAKDRLWFFFSGRNAGVTQTRPGLFANLTPKGWAYTPDPSQPAVIKITDSSENGRLTWQMTPKNKISAFFEIQPHTVWQRNYQFQVTPEATTVAPYLPNSFGTILWRAPATNRLLLEAGLSRLAADYNFRRPSGMDDTTVGVFDSGLGLVYRASIPLGGASEYGHTINYVWRYRGSATYTTGSMTTKIGLEVANGNEIYEREVNGDVAYTFRNGVPLSITQYTTPIRWNTLLNLDLGLFAQEQWTFKRATVNAGVRLDYENGGAEAAQQPATRFLPARSFPRTQNSPNFRDINPRLGVAYDLFGDGKTAVKVAIGRYVNGDGTGGLANLTNPANRSVYSVTRTWRDTNADFVPDCNLANPQANGECTTISNLNFGQNNVNATIYGDDVLRGWGVRGYNWESSASIQREIIPRVSGMVGYYRRWYGNFTVTDNIYPGVGPSAYSPYCITAPVDSRLPSGGQQLCGLYDIDPSLFGRVLNQVKPADQFGKQFSHYNGVDMTINARLGNGITLYGGANVGRLENNRCFVVDSPQELRFCNVKPPFQPNYTFLGTYPLPRGLLVSAVYRNYPGSIPTGATGIANGVTATYAASSAEIAPSLRRPLASGGTASVELIEPGTLFVPRASQLDLRASKSFKVGATRIVGNVDVFNVLNGSGINGVNTTYSPGGGGAWSRPTLVQPARFFKFSAELTF